MYDRYFGIYLLSRGIISREELKSILDRQKQVRVKLGTLAIKRGWMNGRQVEEVVRQQRQVDRCFGELAMEKGYLTESQVEELLSRQAEEADLKLGQAAVDMGLLSYETLEQEMENFESESGLNSIQMKSIKEGDLDKIIESVMEPDSPCCHYYITLLLKNMVRFLDQQPVLVFNMDEEHRNPVVACQYLINNNGEIFTGLMMGFNCLLGTARSFARRDIKANQLDLAYAAVSEFLNVHNGIFAVNMSNRGFCYNLEPPRVFAVNSDWKQADRLHKVHVNLSYGTITVLLGS